MRTKKTARRTTGPPEPPRALLEIESIIIKLLDDSADPEQQSCNCKLAAILRSNPSHGRSFFLCRNNRCGFCKYMPIATHPDEDVILKVVLQMTQERKPTRDVVLTFFPWQDRWYELVYSFTSEIPKALNSLHSSLRVFDQSTSKWRLSIEGMFRLICVLREDKQAGINDIKLFPMVEWMNIFSTYCIQRAHTRGLNLLTANVTPAPRSMKRRRSERLQSKCTKVVDRIDLCLEDDDSDDEVQVGEMLSPGEACEREIIEAEKRGETIIIEDDESEEAEPPPEDPEVVAKVVAKMVAKVVAKVVSKTYNDCKVLEVQDEETELATTLEEGLREETSVEIL